MFWLPGLAGQTGWTGLLLPGLGLRLPGLAGHTGLLLAGLGLRLPGFAGHTELSCQDLDFGFQVLLDRLDTLGFS